MREHNELYHSEPPDILRARRIVAEADCRLHGHSWDVVEALGVGPIAVVCSRCGEHREVSRAVT